MAKVNRHSSWDTQVEVSLCASLTYQHVYFIRAAQSAKCGSRHTLHQPRTILRQVLDNDIPAPVSEKPVQRRFFLVLGNVVAGLDDAASAAAQQLDLIAARIF
jgi:hypothetical protein